MMIFNGKQKIKSYFETIGLFIVLCVILKCTKDNSDFRFIDFKLVFIVTVASMYGIRQGILAICLSCMLYIWNIKNSGIDITYLVYSIDSWMPFVMYILAGAVVGYNIDKKKEHIISSNEKYELLSEDYKQLNRSYKDLIGIKEQLQKQILTSKNSFGRIYEIAKELDTFNPKLIFFKAVSIIENILENDSVCIYMVNSENMNFSRLIANSINLSGKLKSSLNLNELPKLKDVVEKNKFFINKDLDSDYPTYAAPIADGNEVIALVMVYNVDFEKHTLYYQNLFQIIINLIQDNLVKSFKYNVLSQDSEYVEGTNIYKPQAFREQLEIVREAKENIQLSYIKAKVSLAHNQCGNDIGELSDRVSKILRSTDFAGCDESNNCYIVFMQTDYAHIDIIKKRFINAGINLEVEEY